MFEVIKDLHQNWIFHLFWNERTNYSRGGPEFAIVFLSSLVVMFEITPILDYLRDSMDKEKGSLCIKLCIILIGYILLVAYVVYRLIRPSYIIRIAKMRRYHTKRYRVIYWFYWIFVFLFSIVFLGFYVMLLEIKFFF